MGILKAKKEQYLRRKKRSKKPFPIEGEYRLCVYRSAKHIEAQIIDDFIQNTIVAASSKVALKFPKKINKTKSV